MAAATFLWRCDILLPRDLAHTNPYQPNWLPEQLAHGVRGPGLPQTPFFCVPAYATKRVCLVYDTSIHVGSTILMQAFNQRLRHGQRMRRTGLPSSRQTIRPYMYMRTPYHVFLILKGTKSMPCSI